jgi:hypothetical protein
VAVRRARRRTALWLDPAGAGCAFPQSHAVVGVGVLDGVRCSSPVAASGADTVELQLVNNMTATAAAITPVAAQPSKRCRGLLVSSPMRRRDHEAGAGAAARAGSAVAGG